MLIGIAGLAGSGKSTAAAYLGQRYGFVRTRFADPLKNMLRVLGLSHDELDGSLKETPCALIGGRTPRYAMQKLGTEWGRDLIAPDLWIESWKRSVSGQARVVADDLRYANEAEAVRSLGGRLIRVDRPGVRCGTHSSETGVAEIPVDLVMLNDGSFEHLFRQLDAAIAEFRPQHLRAV